MCNQIRTYDNYFGWNQWEAVCGPRRRVLRVASSALQRIHLRCCNTSGPLFPHNAKKKNPLPLVSTILPASSPCEGHFTEQEYASAECLEMVATRSLLFIPLCALSPSLSFTNTFSLSLKMNSSPAQKRGTRRVQRLKFYTDRGNKKPPYRRKIQINPSESAGGFSLRSRRCFTVGLRVLGVFFLTTERE